LAMAAALKLDDVAVELLYKHTDVPAQSGVGSIEKRRANISGVYSVRDEELVRGRRILIIDDIITTGSTLSECAKTLKMFGANEVVCCTLARSRE
ncbi:MAG: phosphoribosyltransferase family protein, partial [Oscillospiraceae bacterium]